MESTAVRRRPVDLISAKNGLPIGFEVVPVEGANLITSADPNITKAWYIQPFGPSKFMYGHPCSRLVNHSSFRLIFDRFSRHILCQGYAHPGT